MFLAIGKEKTLEIEDNAVTWIDINDNDFYEHVFSSENIESKTSTDETFDDINTEYSDENIDNVYSEDERNFYDLNGNLMYRLS